MDIDLGRLKGVSYLVLRWLGPDKVLDDAVSWGSYINCDGCDDFVVGAILADHARINGAGEACMVFDHSREFRNEG